MTIHSTSMPQPDKVQLNLSGPEGNAFAILAYASQYGKKLYPDTYQSILDDMKSQDYDHLIATFDRHFGDYFDIYEK